MRYSDFCLENQISYNRTKKKHDDFEVFIWKKVRNVYFKIEHFLTLLRMA